MRARRALGVVTTMVLAASGAGGEAAEHFACERHAEPATGDLATDIVGRWHLVRHYTDTRYYDVHDDGTADVWYVGLGEPTQHRTVTWSASGDTLHTDESPAMDIRLVLAASPVGPVWRAPDEYVFYPCA